MPPKPKPVAPAPEVLCSPRVAFTITHAGETIPISIALTHAGCYSLWLWGNGPALILEYDNFDDTPHVLRYARTLLVEKIRQLIREAAPPDASRLFVGTAPNGTLSIMATGPDVDHGLWVRFAAESMAAGLRGLPHAEQLAAVKRELDIMRQEEELTKEAHEHVRALARTGIVRDLAAVRSEIEERCPWFLGPAAPWRAGTQTPHVPIRIAVLTLTLLGKPPQTVAHTLGIGIRAVRRYLAGDN